MINPQAIELAKLDWALCHLDAGQLAAPTDQRLIAYLREVHKTKPVAEMWPCLQARLLALYEAQQATEQ